MEFRREVEIAKIYVNGKIEENPVEIRFDPLTLQTSRIIKKSINLNFGGFEEEIESTRSWCPFCSERIENLAAREPIIMKSELWKRGEAIMFANLMPYSKFSLVLRVTEKHYLKLSEFKTEHFFDAFKLIQEFFSRLPEGKIYATIGMNYLKSAGSSIMHPHIQVLFSENSTDYFARLEWGAFSFAELNKKDFWMALVEEEKKNKERFIGTTEKTYWLATFAPKGFYHFMGIPEERNFVDMSDEQLIGLSKGITKILKFYERKGFNSFNFSIFCADRIGSSFRTNLQILARSPFGKYYWCDVFFTKMLQDESVTFFMPEDYAKELREIWEKL
ncbi:MAG: hypothetical protein NZ895_01885 [Archaeoglobaceae archaeon]|nr:hypothetical protein [Archaeoglobaceae archaeon]MCX8151567.1 hypothetical protein [Archaeoglobaceae archaeon]MDW8013155.1 hypothetical protein [Archaeoglobaceae archaeon]